MMKSTVTVLFLILSTSFASADDITPELRATTTEAMEQHHMGFMVGVGNPEGSLNPGGQYSIEYGFQPYVPFGLSIEGGYAYFTENDFNFSRSSVLVEGSYNFGGETPIIKYGYVALALGAAWEDATTSEGLAALVAPRVGFDFPLESLVSAPISIGVDASYLVSSRGTPDVFTTSGVLKYWFR